MIKLFSSFLYYKRCFHESCLPTVFAKPPCDRGREKQIPLIRLTIRVSRISRLRSAIRNRSTSSHAGRWSSDHRLLFPLTLSALGRDPLMADAPSPADIGFHIPFTSMGGRQVESHRREINSLAFPLPLPPPINGLEKENPLPQ